MEKNNKNIAYNKIINIDDLIFDLIISDNNEAEKILNEFHIDINEIKSKGLVYLREIQIKHDMSINRENRNFLLEQAKSEMKNVSKRYNQETLLQSMQVQFRQLKSFKSEDFVEMLDEVELLKFIEELRKVKIESNAK